MTDRRQWTSEEEDALISILQEIVANGGQYETGTFRPGTYNQVVLKMRDLISNIQITSKHVQNKIKRLKDKYSAAYDMLNTSGFGWDGSLKCVTADSGVLEEYLKKHPNKTYTANKPFPAYERLKFVFGKIRATRSMNESAADVIGNIHLENEDTEMANFSIPNIASPSNTPSTSTASTHKRKMSDTSINHMTKILQDEMITASAEMAKLTEVIAELKDGLISTNVNPIVSLSEKLKTMGVDQMQVFRIGRYFGKNRDELEFFNTLTDSEKLDFIRAMNFDV